MTKVAGRSRPPLGTYLALAFTGVCVVLTLVLTLILQRSAGDTVGANIGSRMTDIAHLVALRLDRGLSERYREIRLLAGRVAEEADPARVRRQLDAARSSYGYYTWIGVADAQGVVQVDSGGNREGRNVSERPWFRNATLGIHLTDVHEAEVQRETKPTGSEAALRVLNVAFPLTTAAGLHGVLGAQMSWQWASDIHQTAVDAQKANPVQPVVLSRQGEVLLGPAELVGTTLGLGSARRAMAGGEGFVVEEWPDGKRYLVGYSPTRGFLSSPGLGWKVLVRQELDLAYAPVHQLRRRVVAAGLALALLFSVLGWLAARGVTRPLLHLAEDARRLQAGEVTEVRRHGKYREVETLGATINSLVGDLKRNEAELSALNADLERRVELRALELSVALERSRADQQRVQTLIEAAQDAFIGMDLDGRVTDWNPRAETLFGWRREEVLGGRLEETVVREGDRAVFRGWLESFRATGEMAAAARPIERIVRDRTGRELPVELRVTHVSHGDQRFVGVFVQDIRERKAMERLKDELVSTVSHELRTPLTAIFGSLSLLNSGLAGEMPPQAVELLNICHESAQRLIRLVNEMLDMETIASGRMEYRMEEQPLRPLVEQALRDTQAYAEALGVAFRFEPGSDARVRADAHRIVQVCVHLLSNAAKFSPRNGEVDVRMDVVEGWVRVRVIDRGPGIPPAFRDRVFERFAQADASDRRAKGGTGLGLAICRGIVEAHQGRIGFDGRPDVGTEFFFELPLA